MSGPAREQTDPIRGERIPVDSRLFASLARGAPARVWRSRMERADLLRDPGVGVTEHGSPAHRVMVLQAGLKALERAERRQEEAHAEVPVQLEYPRPVFYLAVVVLGLALTQVMSLSSALPLTLAAFAVGFAVILASNTRRELARREIARVEATAALEEARASMTTAGELVVATAQANPRAFDAALFGHDDFDHFNEATMDPWEVEVSTDRTRLDRSAIRTGQPAPLPEDGIEVALPE